MRDAVANIDDYKLQTTVTVPFGFNKSALTADSRQELDKLAQDVQSDKRFFIAVEGYTDKTGGAAYNEVLSRKRADAVVEYLVAKHDIPIYRIHMIGLGDEKPVDEAHNRAARAKNRRVEVKVFNADDVTANVGASTSANRVDSGHYLNSSPHFLHAFARSVRSRGYEAPRVGQSEAYLMGTSSRWRPRATVIRSSPHVAVRKELFGCERAMGKSGIGMILTPVSLILFEFRICQPTPTPFLPEFPFRPFLKACQKT